MNRMLLTIFSACCFSLSAQITVTNATFPAVGDTLLYALDPLPSGMESNITPPGGPQTWDFTGIQPVLIRHDAYLNASEGAAASSFPNAEMVLIGLDGETYFDKTPSAISIQGFSGTGGLGLTQALSIKFAPQVPDRRAPLNFFDINVVNSNLNIAFSTDILPDSINIPIPGVDSLRVRVASNRTDLVDGYGTANIPGGSFPVLREKRTEFSETKLDAHTFLGWVDITDFLGGGGGGIGGFLGTDTTITYRFYSATEKELIAEMTVSNDLSSVTYLTVKSIDLVPTHEVDLSGAPTIQAYPNPAVDMVSFEVSNLPTDEYSLKIYNLVGKVVWKENYTLNGNKSIKVDLNNFKKGTYLYSLTDQKGKVIGAKRLVVVKP